MKRYRIPLIGISLLLFIAFTLAFPALARTIDGFGTVYSSSEENISSGLHYAEFLAEQGGDPQHGYLLTYTPGGSTAVRVSSNLSVYGRSTLSNTIHTEQLRGTDVVAGINGDFFIMQTGVPMGITVSEGRLLSSCDNRPAMGIRADGSAIIGYPQTAVTLTRGSDTFSIPQFNKTPTVYGCYLLDDCFFTSTKSTSASTEIVIRMTDGYPTMGGTVSGIIQGIYTDTTDTDIAEGCFVLSVNNQSPQLRELSTLQLGDLVQISFAVAAGWEDVTNACGAGDIILQNGVMPEGIVNEAHESTVNPRTAAGITADGRLLFFAADGRRKDSRGLTLEQLSDTMRSLGCVSAVNFDGGGSTTVVLKDPADGDMITANTPSDGYQRKIATSILFVNTDVVTNIPGFLTVSPSSTFLLRGSSLPYTLTVRDTSYKLMPGALMPGMASFSLSDPSVGYFSESTFVAEKAGQTTVTASVNLGGKLLSATSTLTVVEHLDNFTVSPAFARIPSGQRVDLNLMGYLSGAPIEVDAAAFTFSFGDAATENLHAGALASCAAGYIGTDGFFYAHNGTDGQTVTFTVSYSSPLMTAPKTETVSIRVGIEPEIIDAFEGTGTVEEIYAQDPMSSIAYVTDGFKSDGALALNGYSVIYDTPLVISANIDRFELWVKGDLFGKAYICVTDQSGIQFDLYYRVEEDYSRIGGWKKLVADLPDEAESPISIDSLFVSTGAVSLTLDSLTANYGDKGTVFHDIENSWAKNEILSLYHMELTDGTFDALGNRIYEPGKVLTVGEYAKLLTMLLKLDTAYYGSIFCTPDSFYAETGLRFADEASIPAWALPYIRAAAAKGYLIGTADDAGNITIGADTPISRLEVMYASGLILANWQPDQPTPDDGVLHGIRDAKLIPDYAKDQVKRVLMSGIFTVNSSGELNVTGHVTRADIAVVFDRLVKS